MVNTIFTLQFHHLLFIFFSLQFGLYNYHILIIIYIFNLSKSINLHPLLNYLFEWSFLYLAHFSSFFFLIGILNDSIFIVNSYMDIMLLLCFFHHYYRYSIFHLQILYYSLFMNIYLVFLKKHSIKVHFQLMSYFFFLFIFIHNCL